MDIHNLQDKLYHHCMGRQYMCRMRSKLRNLDSDQLGSRRDDSSQFADETTYADLPALPGSRTGDYEELSDTKRPAAPAVPTENGRVTRDPGNNYEHLMPRVAEQ